MDILRTVALFVAAIFSPNNLFAEIVYQSGTLGQTDIPRIDVGSQIVPGANVSEFVFIGARFQLAQPALITRLGGHFVGPFSDDDTFFGAIVRLTDQYDFPNSSDLSTSDVLGATGLTFPDPSEEVLGELSLELQAGWYAVIFGSGLFNTSGKGAAVRNGEDLDNPSFISWQLGALGDGWFDLDVFPPEFSGNLRFVVEGTIIPESISLALDIKPGSDGNPVNLKSRGVLPVAVLSTDDFDASDIDVETLLFGDPLLLDDGGTAVSPLRFAFEDVSDDGLVDLTLKFSLPELVDFGALGPDSIEGLLTGTLFDGTPIEGADSIRIVPPNGTHVNSLQTSAIPEPSSFLLAAALLALLSTTARCRF